MAHSLLVAGLGAWLLGAVIALTGRGLGLARGLIVVGALLLVALAICHAAGGAGAGSDLPRDRARHCRLCSFAGSAVAARLRASGSSVCDMARHAVAAQAGMGVRRRRVSRWGARCLRHAGCRDVPHCVGDHEPRRRIDDPRRGSRAGFRPTGAPDARPTRGRFRRADPRLRHPGRPCGKPLVFRLRGRRGVDAARRAALRRSSPPDRFRREARPATVLRMVSRRLWRGKRRDRRNPLRRRSQRRLLCACARIDRLAAGRLRLCRSPSPES